MQQIQLGRSSYVAVVDDEDYELVRGKRWKALRIHNSELVYAIRYEIVDGQTRAFLMHREILGLERGDGMVVDHKDGSGLNNTRENLRVCSHAENMRNRRMHANNRSGVKGVYIDPRRPKKYRAQISVDGRRLRLGNFYTLEEAQAAYTEAAESLHGEFARPT